MTGTPLTLEQMEALILGMDADTRKELENTLKPILAEVWLPQPGPQTEAYYSPADELLYGGAVGGGKTDLVGGLALTAHERSLVFRRQSTDLDGLWTRLEEIAGGTKLTNNSVKKRMICVNKGKRLLIEGGHLDAPGAEKTWQGRPHDLIAFDEGAQLEEQKVAFVIRWLRSTTAGQRCRMVIATNPPIPEYKDGKLVDFGTGLWLKEWFAPWLDPAFPDPAKDGELRWCYMVADNDRLKTVWVEEPGVYSHTSGDWLGGPELYDENNKDHVAARSRTFIRSRLSDNIYFKGSGYAEKMSSTPEPLRSMLMNGDFNIKLEDNPFQIIPTNWVLEAEKRWNDNRQDMDALTQLVMCGDVAQGGSDATTLASLLDENHYDEIKRYPGSETPDGPAVAIRLLGYRRHNSLVVLDGGGGWAGDTKRTLQRDNNIEAILFQPSTSDGEWNNELKMKYLNLRASAWWKFRAALNPASGENVRLPPNERLRTQLTSVLWRMERKFIIVESKDDVRARIGSSTDEADAVIMAWYYRETAIARRLKMADQPKDYSRRARRLGLPQQTRETSVPLDDPLGEWNELR
jgi:hypothetical protein